MKLGLTMVILAVLAVLAMAAEPPAADLIPMSGISPTFAALTSDATETESLIVNRDKNGATGCGIESRDSQTTERSVVAEHSSLEAERMGFEPMVEFPPHSISSAAPSAARSPLRVCFRLRSGRCVSEFMDG